jgi:hypothetical protein
MGIKTKSSMTGSQRSPDMVDLPYMILHNYAGVFF